MIIETCDWTFKDPVIVKNQLRNIQGNGKAHIVESRVTSNNLNTLLERYNIDDDSWVEIDRSEIPLYARMNHDIFYIVGRGVKATIYRSAIGSKWATPESLNTPSISRSIGRITTPTSTPIATSLPVKTIPNPVKLTESPNVKELIEKVRNNGDLKEQMLQHKINGLILDYLNDAETQ